MHSDQADQILLA